MNGDRSSGLGDRIRLATAPAWHRPMALVRFGRVFRPAHIRFYFGPYGHPLIVCSGGRLSALRKRHRGISTLRLPEVEAFTRARPIVVKLHEGVPRVVRRTVHRSCGLTTFLKEI
jgi:hypothetical protein